MKKILLTSAFTLTMLFAFGQSKPQTTKPSAPPAVTKKDSMFCKEWKFTGVEEFGVEIAPSEKQKNDGVNFSLDKKATVTHSGVTKAGTWTTDKYRSSIIVSVDNSNEKRLYTIKKLESESMTLEHQDSVLIRTLYKYVVVTK